MPQVPHESKTPLNPYRWFLDNYNKLYNNNKFKSSEYLENRSGHDPNKIFGKARMNMEDCKRLSGCDGKDMWRIFIRANNHDVNKYLTLVAIVVGDYVSYFLSVLEKEMNWIDVCAFISDMYEDDWLSITNGETKSLAEMIYKDKMIVRK